MIGPTACALGIALLATAVGAQSFEDVPEEEWLELFNGRDLEGWVVKLTGQDPGEDPLGTVRVEDGVMRIAYDRYERFEGDFGHIFYERPFSHYVLRLEYRFLGEQAVGGPDWAVRNSGAMLHSQSPESMGRDQDFPISIEAQFLGGAGEGERPTGNLCTPGSPARGRRLLRRFSDHLDRSPWLKFPPKCRPLKPHRLGRFPTVRVAVHSASARRRSGSGSSPPTWVEDERDDGRVRTRDEHSTVEEIATRGVVRSGVDGDAHRLHISGQNRRGFSADTREQVNRLELGLTGLEGGVRGAEE